jgi:arabinogalactan endo-1,4-beta-galactosidase
MNPWSAIMLAAALVTPNLRGVDVSSLSRAETRGAVYRDSLGRPGDALVILRAHGVNAVRLRVWVDPADGANRIDAVVPMARRARDLGLDVVIDLHYSDGWADPGKQVKPAAWRDLSFAALTQAVGAHTRAVCESLRAAGVTPRIVQVGNEINDGLLWPDGRASLSLDRTAALVAAGAAAVRAASPASLVMIHVAATDTIAVRWLLDGLAARGVRWDVTGLSYYAMWHGDLAHLQRVLDDVATRYGRPVVIVETAAPFTLANADPQENVVHDPAQIPPGMAATPAGQAEHVEGILASLRRVPHDRGWGFFWWEGTWTAVPGNGWDPGDPAAGNGWENQALFDFEGRPLPALSKFRP